MVEQDRVVERLQLRELGQVLLDNCRVVLQEHVVQVLGDEGGQAGPGKGFVVEIEVDEWGS